MLKFNEERHEYWDDGVKLPSVTEICKFTHAGAYENASPHLRELAAMRGTMVHELCTQLDIEGEVDGVPMEIIGYLNAYADFKRDYSIKGWKWFERPVGGKELGYAGTLDRAGWIDGKFTILDIKTGSKINKLSLLAQLEGYAMATEHMEKTQRLMGLQLKRDGRYYVYEFEPYRENSPWQHCLSLYKLQGELKCRKKKQLQTTYHNGR